LNIMPAPAEFLKYVDDNADRFVQRLAKAVEIKSVSGDVSYRENVVHMAKFLERELQAVGAQVKLVPLGKQKRDGPKIDLPPVLFASIGNDPKKKTILCYGHYDVQPALKSDGWVTEPFQLVVNERKELVGRGSTDDKGPVLGWINVLEAHKNLGLELPVNLKFCFEGMEESGSEGLDDLIRREVGKGKFFEGVDAVCITDNYWLNARTPCLTYGLRGISYYKIIIKGLAFDLHSGAFGGTVYEPMTDLIHIMGRLVTPQGKILIPGVVDLVPPPNEDERKAYKALDYSMKDFKKSVGDKSDGEKSKNGLSDDLVTLLLGRMRMPSLSLHGIEGASSGPDSKTVIPCKVTGKFSIRLVPNQTPDKIMDLVEKYIKSEFNKLGSKNELEILFVGGGKPWVDNHEHWNYVAAKKATMAVYNKMPDLTREGGSIPVTLTFAEELKVNVLLLPMGRGDGGEHSTNEKLDWDNYIKGTKLFGTYLYEAGSI